MDHRLVHEAHIRLRGDSAKGWGNRDHFLGVAAKAVRHFLVDYARAGEAAKHTTKTWLSKTPS